MKVFIFLFVTNYFADVLARNSQMICPDDRFYNKKTGNCTECLPGYFASNCSKLCRYPNYGNECQDQCPCREEYCNHIFGCIEDPQDIKEPKDRVNTIIAVTVTGIILIIIAFIILSIANRKFFTRHISQNAHYVDTVIAEHTEHTYNPHLHRNTEYSRPDETCAQTDNGMYMLANTLLYEYTAVHKDYSQQNV